MTSGGQSDFLNLVRWVAAQLVVLEHARSLLFVNGESIHDSGLLTKAFYFGTGFGHESVVVFFVISGFLVGGKVWDAFRIHTFDVQRYLVDRTSRLYAVLLVALLLGGATDYVGARFANGFGFYTRQAPDGVAVISGIVVERLSVRHFLCSLLMLQDIVLPCFGSNGPLWSLAYEWWYYLLFPLVLAVCHGSPLTRGLAAVAVIVLGAWLPISLLILFGVWLIGVLAWSANSWRRFPLMLALVAFSGAIVAMRLEVPAFPYAHQYTVGCSFALLLNSLGDNARRLPMHHLSRRLADFSYSLYLIHFPVLLLATSTLFSYLGRNRRLDFTWYNMCCFFFIFCLANLVSYGVSLGTEAQTQRLRSGIHRLLNR